MIKEEEEMNIYNYKNREERPQPKIQGGQFSVVVYR